MKNEFFQVKDLILALQKFDPEAIIKIQNKDLLTFGNMCSIRENKALGNNSVQLWQIEPPET